MNKIILKDKSEIKIHDGASLSQITTEVNDYTALGALAEKLTPDNLKKVQFAQDAETGNVTGEYVNMALMEPHFTVTQMSDKLMVSFGLRELSAEEIREPAVMAAISYLSDEQAITVKGLYPEWDVDKTYSLGDRVRHDGKLYRCLQAHTSQSDWNPEEAVSLWAEILTQPGEILPWTQPDSTNGYNQGDKVTYNDRTWESLIDNNVWEPGAVGTESLWQAVQ